MGKKPEGTACGADVLHAIRNAYPDCVVSDEILYTEDSYYDKICEDVRVALHRIKGTTLMYERPPEGRPHWNEESDPEGDPPDWTEEPSSYDLTFLGLEDDRFEFEGELDEEDIPEGAEDSRIITVPTAGRIGCAVGISTIAPFAVVHFTDMQWTENGSGTLPDIHPSLFELDGSAVDMEAHYEELYLEEGIRALRELRKKIAKVLRGFGIRVLSDDALRPRIPELHPDPATYLPAAPPHITVEAALFLRQL